MSQPTRQPQPAWLRSSRSAPDFSNNCQWVDVVISNGVVNLAPDKSRVFAEIQRVLRPGGRLYLADVVVQREMKYKVRNNADL